MISLIFTRSIRPPQTTHFTLRKSKSQLSILFDPPKCLHGEDYSSQRREHFMERK